MRALSLVTMTIIASAIACQPVVHIDGPTTSEPVSSLPSDTLSQTSTDTTSPGSDGIDSSSGTSSVADSESMIVPTGCTAMDILFVIDDSFSMECEQDALGLSFPGFIEVLESYSNENTEAISWRVGVTTSGRSVWGTFHNPPLPDIPFNEKGLDGRLVTAPGSVSPWLDGPDPQGEVAQRFAQMALVGTQGPTYEMPLACMRLAISKSEPGGENDGFLRPNALFVVVIITDEDDCSRPDEDNGFQIPNDDCMSNPAKHNLVPLEDFREFLDERFGPAGYVVVVIAGAQRCAVSQAANCLLDDPANAGAYQATRLLHFADVTIHPNGVFSDICTFAFTAALEEALSTMKVACDDFAPK